jgi:hypothetical protein
MKYFVFAAALVVGCGGGSGDESPSIPLGDGGFPNVAGRYSFNTSAVRMSCTDGATATNPPIALNLDVSQSGNVITLANADGAGGVPGIDVVERSDATGNVQPNARFIVNQAVSARIDGVSDTVSIIYSTTGRFSISGWSGTYEYSIASASVGTCRFVSSFNGSRLNSTKRTAAPLTLAYRLSIFDVLYDQDGVIGATGH